MINIQEETKRLNVWVTYFNLEMEYKNPPQKAISKVFQTSLQYMHPKKDHIALLVVYEWSELHTLVDKLLEKTVKRFKHSFKVLLVSSPSPKKLGVGFIPRLSILLGLVVTDARFAFCLVYVPGLRGFKGSKR